jgi:hypothetical protein
MTRRAIVGRTFTALTASLLLAATDVAAQTSGGGSTGGTSGGSTGGAASGSITGPSTRTGPSVGPSATQPGGPSPQRLPGPPSTPGTSEQFAPRPGATSPTISGPTPRSQQPGGGLQDGTNITQPSQPNLPTTGSGRTPNRAQGAAQGAAVGQSGDRRPEQGSEMSIEECIRTWSPDTHMPREQYEATCRRVEARDREVEKR